MSLITPPVADGFNPRISPDGRYVACGLGTGSVYDRVTGQVVRLGRGFNGAWLGPTVVAFRSDAQMFRATAPAFNPVPLDSFVGPANWNDANAGVYAVGANGAGRGWVQVNGVEVVSGPEIRGAAVDTDGSVVFTNGDWLIQRRLPNGQIVNIAPVQVPTAIRVGYGHIAYGYSGPSFVSLPDGRQIDVTVTPNRKEGVPAIFQHAGAIWLATPNDEGEFAGIFLRPLGSVEAIWVKTPAVWADVVSVGGEFVIASCTARGQVTIQTVPVTASRQRLVSAPPPPPPPPTTQPSPEPPQMPTVEQATQEFKGFLEVLKRHRAKVPNGEWSRNRAPYVMRDALIEDGRGGGLLKKPSGDNAFGFSADNVVFPWEGIYWTFDVFVNVETKGTPTFGTTAKPGTTADGKLDPNEIANFVRADRVKLPGDGAPAPQPELEPQPEPEPPPTPPSPAPGCQCAADLRELKAVLFAVTQRLEAGEATATTRQQELLARQTTLETLLKASRKVTLKAGWLGTFTGTVEGPEA